ncbi:hypothetical protein FRC20_010241 [Serendipita sp. 405]|nr:hypothetical protein FRC18_011345 [Serendipita sp. 400]KAG8864402.1 hypothetical protein FRC20_010241 [Serendipita sp. 405]
MTRSSSFLTIAGLTSSLSTLVYLANAQSFIPLASQSFTYTNLPYQADPNDGERGRQSGYNICNSTTENQESLCQTAIINSLDDFCLWGPQHPNEVIGNVEGESVAWCTKPGHGTRLIPKGALTAVQFMKTPDYVQVTGLINQVLIDIAASDDGGELDPHGADQRGNPLGGLLFSNAWTGNYVQAVEWHNFMGGGAFCLKACDPSRPNAARYCEHIYDRIGCNYNAPAAYAPDVFESCLGDSQDFPGIYTGSNGQTSTYQQPPESLGAITSIPYNPRIPASSSCTAGVSSELYASAPAATISLTTSTSSTSSRSSTSSSRSTRPVTSTVTVNPTSTNPNAASGSISRTGFAGLLGAVGAVLFGVVVA